MHDIAIQLIDIHKQYLLFHEKPTLLGRVVRSQKERFFALKNINLTIRKGEKIGIIGHNGAGKTTLLKIIAGITTPTSGTRRVNGKVVSIIDREAGFHADLTGEQNIYFSGLLLGLSRREIKEKYQKIISYSQLERFIDTPIFTYSTGMKLRLGFSIAIQTRPDILIMDEGLAGADGPFRRKVRRTLNALHRNGTTLIFCTHDADFIKQQCDRILVVNRGSITRDGGLEQLDQLGYIIERPAPYYPKVKKKRS